MVLKLQRLDPDRRRRRLELLAELADAKAVRGLVRSRLGTRRVPGWIALRRRVVG